MACKALPRNARTILNPRYQPNPMQELPATRQAHASSSRVIRMQTPTHEEILAPVVLRYEKHHDTLPVNSIEERQHPPSLTGVKHYLHMLSEKGLDLTPSLDHINYDKLKRLQDDWTAREVSEDEPALQTAPSPPSPPPSPMSYNQPIYTGTTHNPAIFLSILRIAKRTRPDVNLASAIDHIPNLRPTDPFPSLFPAALGNLATQPFLDNLANHAWPKRAGDLDVTVSFLPYFYDAGARHAIGYYNILTCPRRGRVLGTAFFTPCTEEDLRRYGLVEYLEGAEAAGVVGGYEEVSEGVDMMRCVGCENGAWIDKDTVEEYADWKVAYRVASVAWEGRMGLTRGDLEG